MKKLAFTTAVALVLATSAYAQNHMHGGGGGGAPSANSGASRGPSGGGPGNFSAPRGPSGPSTMGPSNIGPSNRTQTMNGPKTGGEQFSNRFSEGNRLNDRERLNGTQFSNRERLNDRDRRLYNRYGDRDRDVVRGDQDRNVQGDFRHRGVERGNFFEHGRRFGFRRFWHGQWVFLNGWDDCTAFVWVHVAPGVWAWQPVDICIG